jgi:hypothetical protein
MENKEKIKTLVIEMLNESHNAMLKKLETIINSDSINLDSWNEIYAPMLLPKMIVTALLESEPHQYSVPKDYPNKRKIKQDINNIKYII